MDEFAKKIRLHKPGICKENIYNYFSILIPIIQANTKKTDLYDCSLLFEVRSKSLNRQPGEICFPGGKIENHETGIEAAVRETSEELMLESTSINVIGELDTIVTPFNTIISTYVGIVEEYEYTFNSCEVQEIFSVPVKHFIETKPLCSNVKVIMKPGFDFPYHLIQNGVNYSWAEGIYPVYFYKYENRIIWGITARIIYSLVEILKS